MKKKEFVCVMSIDDQGSVFIAPIDITNIIQLERLRTITYAARHERFPNIQAAVVEFLRPIYRKICGK